MNKEINEILDKIEKVANKETASYNALTEMKNTDYQLLLDYITDLREQNNDLRRIYKNTYNRLFKNGNDELARYFQAQIGDCRTFYAEPIIDYAKEWIDYKSRINKAIEYINSFEEENPDYPSNFYNDGCWKTSIGFEDLVENTTKILRGKDDD